MSKKFSSYLKENLPLLEELIATLEKKYKYCSVLGCDSSGTSVVVNTRQTKVTETPFSERGFVVRIHNGMNYAEYSFNDINKNNLKDIVKKIDAQLVLNEKFKKDKFIKLDEYKILNEEKINKDFERVYKGNELDAKEIVKNLTEIKDSIQAKENVINANAVFQELDISKVFISNSKHLTQFYTWTVGNISIMVSKDNDTRFSYASTSGVEPNDVFDGMRKLIDDVYKDASDMINCEAPVPGVYDIIACPDITGLIAHEAFGHGVEMDMFVKGRALGQKYVNKPVASKHVTMHEGAKGDILQVSSYFFDDEGTLAHDTIEIEKGILKSGVCDAISALVLGVEPTGNGKRESFERKAYSRMTATYFEPGNSTLDEMIKSIKNGFLIDVGYSGMEDPKNWGIQCAALIGREIKDGKLTGKVVSPVMMTGYVPDLLGSIDMLTTDVELFGSGMCGKGYKEWVKVSDGGPYLKARVSIG